MAEAAVEERPRSRFYCHVCNVEFQNAANNFTCPHCSDGFIEELQDNREDSSAAANRSRLLSDEESIFMEDILRLNSNSPNDVRRLTRLASANLRQPPLPIGHLVQDFIINLGVGVNLGGPENVQLFLGNPGDYAWGREGLDAIVTQLLNQMDSTGPPPVSKAVIDALQVVEVTAEQVAQNVQCSVCWEQFQLKEQVRQLPCLHIYHEACIRPWLELHGTCPICRQNLGDDEGGNQSNNDQTGVEAATGQATNLQNALRTLFGASPSDSRTNPNDQSGSSSSTPPSFDGGN